MPSTCERGVSPRRPPCYASTAITAVQTNMHNGLSQRPTACRTTTIRSTCPTHRSQARCRRTGPYQPWADILYLNSGGDSTLHQLQIKAIKRVSHGLNFQIEYSWNRSLDDTPITGGPQNPFDNRGNYELPFGPGKRFV